MELLIVSGLSGAGKSVAMNALEDIGFFCIDNVPAELLPSITAFSKAGDNQLERVALSMDVRGCRSREQIETALQQLDEQKTPYKILFLDAPDDVLMRRYSETRRRHPISIAEGISTRDAFLKERQILQPLKERANYTINTGLLSTSQNKERICDLFMKNGGAKNAMRLTIMSFGFKFGLPPEADLVLDVRCLPNLLGAGTEAQDRTGSGSGRFCHGLPRSTGAAAPVRELFAVRPAALCQGRQKPADHCGGLHRRQAPLHHIRTQACGILHLSGLRARGAAPGCRALKTEEIL
mgnify:CR=1 FL=1